MTPQAQPALAEAPEQPLDAAPAEAPAPAEQELVVEDLLVEDVSIDGMCGVY